jgi:predicted phosphodiesterase
VRYLILSDIHANWEALDAVLNDASGEYDSILNCGDLVGYGPDPAPVVDFCRKSCKALVRGNHDKAVGGQSDIEWFNPVARAAVEWSQTELSEGDLAYVAGLPTGPVEHEGFTLAHGAPQDEDEYIITLDEARLAAATAPTGLVFFGHTHIQGGFFVHRNGTRPIEEPEMVIDETATYLINPGSVGQPRDGDPRAAYAIYNSDNRLVRFARVEYDVATVYMKIKRVGLPEVLGLRLFRGV